MHNDDVDISGGDTDSLPAPTCVATRRGYTREVALESRYDQQFAVVFGAIRELVASPPDEPPRRIGFGVDAETPSREASSREPST